MQMDIDGETGPGAWSSSLEAPNRSAQLPVPKEEQLEDEKTGEIVEACNLGDIRRLKELAESEGGLLTDVLRRRAWPILLGIPIGTTEAGSTTEPEETQAWRELPDHKDEEQVQLDVNRAFVYYPNNETETELERRKGELSDLIVEVLRRYPYLCYFQGYHDICQVFLLVLDPPWRARLVARLSVLRIRDFMLPTLAATVHQLRLIPDILDAVDPKLRRHLGDIEPFYALSGTLTMYAHVIEEYGAIARLFDALLSREPVFSIYMYAQIVLSRREELFDFPQEDSSMLHLVLSKVPKKLDLEVLISTTADLFERHPPESLPTWRRISSSSSLKTARTLDCAGESLEDGRVHFAAHVEELRRQERWDKLIKKALVYRKPAQAALVAVIVSMVAVYLRKHPTPFNYMLSGFWRLRGGR